MKYIYIIFALIPIYITSYTIYFYFNKFFLYEHNAFDFAFTYYVLSCEFSIVSNFQDFCFLITVILDKAKNYVIFFSFWYAVQGKNSHAFSLLSEFNATTFKATIKKTLRLYCILNVFFKINNISRSFM